jgi:hypothetical protein
VPPGDPQSDLAVITPTLHGATCTAGRSTSDYLIAVLGTGDPRDKQIPSAGPRQRSNASGGWPGGSRGGANIRTNGRRIGRGAGDDPPTHLQGGRRPEDSRSQKAKCERDLPMTRRQERRRGRRGAPLGRVAAGIRPTLHCIALHCTVLPCIILHYGVLTSSGRPSNFPPTRNCPAGSRGDTAGGEAGT